MLGTNARHRQRTLITKREAVICYLNELQQKYIPLPILNHALFRRFMRPTLRCSDRCRSLPSQPSIGNWTNQDHQYDPLIIICWNLSKNWGKAALNGIKSRKFMR